ncbi:MAG: cytochrome c nitrite reductase small subunit, partial [Candidatus Aminicenantes bacterium]|nr:cytochrome c nitrite reductase small subunit [Candidatus Aminicenantes bacterium]
LFSGILLLLIFFSMSPLIVRETSTPSFCGSCHVMETEYEDWFKTGLHRNIICVDCHLPNNNIFSHLIWKVLDGTKDVIFFYGHIYSDQITISEHGKKTIKSNCIRCHKGMVSRMNVKSRDCWSCHRRVNHTFPADGINNL